ncbi:ninjurin-1-like [Littorina saxatilis]|uniref:ninjurin-1-like n=1 Tax=Littorina saxatilis TaxID=31220 RepID=UPI0038B47E2D
MLAEHSVDPKLNANLITPERGINIDVATPTEAMYDQKFSNSYTSKKTIANSVMNVALIMANVSQLKVLTTSRREETTLFFIPLLVLLSLSLLLQVITAVVLIVLGTMKKSCPVARKTNNAALILISVVTFINLLISGLFDS